MTMTLRLSALLGCLLLACPLAAQQHIDLDEETLARYRTAPLAQLETELAELGKTVLQHEVFQYKDFTNARFLTLLQTVLARQDSYDYPFAKLETVSRLFPKDNSFRIFTWVLVNQTTDGKQEDYYHFGIVQRKWLNPQTRKPELHVIPLEDRLDATPTIENDILDPSRWLGALYYQPKDEPFGVISQKGIAARVNAKGKLIKEPTNYYVLLGFNGHDILANYKILEVITLDPRNPTGVQFGAPIFYFASIPKTRGVFRYSQNAIFSLNMGGVRDPKTGKVTRMIVYDHLAEPNNDKLAPGGTTLGADGSYDAMAWLNKVNQQRKGFYTFLRNVDVYHPEMEHLSPEKVRQQAAEDQRKLREANIIK